jgi:hypothetical protein
VDSLIAAAARALGAGDPLAALDRVALRHDPPAVALRGIAMAQLGEYERARRLLRQAARRFSPEERLERARCEAAEAEVALAARDLRPSDALDAAARSLETLGDHENALHARLVAVRRMLLLGRLEAAEAALSGLSGLSGLSTSRASPALTALSELTRAELALRGLRAAEATAALRRSHAAAMGSGIPALIAEVEEARRALERPAARVIQGGSTRILRLAEVETLLATDSLVVDACRRAAREASECVNFTGRPVLFALLQELAEAFPVDAPRDPLIEHVFGARRPNDSHRVRLRVELGRLRKAMRSIARIEATQRGYVLVPLRARAVVVLAPPMDGPAGAVVALLEGGAPWSTSAIAAALGASQRTVQRALRELSESGAVRAVGAGRARRWLAPAPGGFATTLLLPGSLPVG